MKITIEHNGEKYEVPTTLITPPAPEPIPVPVPPPPPPPKKHVLLNCINWNLNALNNLPLQDASEFTYFVLPVNADGSLRDINPTLETKFVADVHNAGKKATFSIAGGTNNIATITAAVNEKTRLVNAIKAHMTQFGYDGVTVDIEGTAISSQAMKEFIILLRTALGPDKIIGCYVQQYQMNTVWAKISEYISSLDWFAPMLYDSGIYNKQQMYTWMSAWIGRIPKDKLMVGVAVNYPAQNTGLNEAQLGEMCDLVNGMSIKGIGLWQNVSYTESWRQVRRNKLPNIT